MAGVTLHHANGIGIVSNPGPEDSHPHYQLKENSRPGTKLPGSIAIINQKDLDSQTVLGDEKKLYTFFSSRGVTPSSPAPIIVTVLARVQPKDVEEFDRWYEEEHVDLLTKIPGWLRTQRFRRVPEEQGADGLIECIAIHDYEIPNGLGGQEHKAAMSTEWRERIQPMIQSSERGVWEIAGKGPA